MTNFCGHAKIYLPTTNYNASDELVIGVFKNEVIKMGVVQFNMKKFPLGFGNQW